VFLFLLLLVFLLLLLLLLRFFRDNPEESTARVGQHVMSQLDEKKATYITQLMLTAQLRGTKETLTLPVFLPLQCRYPSGLTQQTRCWEPQRLRGTTENIASSGHLRGKGGVKGQTAHCHRR
jgi:hypothetical protein